MPPLLSLAPPSSPTSSSPSQTSSQATMSLSPRWPPSSPHHSGKPRELHPILFVSFGVLEPPFILPHPIWVPFIGNCWRLCLPLSRLRTYATVAILATVSLPIIPLHGSIPPPSFILPYHSFMLPFTQVTTTDEPPAPPLALIASPSRHLSAAIYYDCESPSSL